MASPSSSSSSFWNHKMQSTSWRVRIALFLFAVLVTFLQIFASQSSSIIIVWSDASTVILQDAPTKGNPHTQTKETSATTTTTTTSPSTNLLEITPASTNQEERKVLEEYTQKSDNSVGTAQLKERQTQPKVAAEKIITKNKKRREEKRDKKGKVALNSGTLMRTAEEGSETVKDQDTSFREGRHTEGSKTKEESPASETETKEEATDKDKSEKATTNENHGIEPKAANQDAATDANTTADTSSTSITQSSVPFTGTKIVELSPGVNRYENVCIYRQKKKGVPAVYAYTPNAKQITHTAIGKFRKGHEAFMLEPVSFPLEQWEEDVKKAGGVVFPNETVWTQVLYNNPAHALTDVIFNLALDQYSRPEAVIPGQPFYQNYLIGRLQGFDDPPLHPKAKYKWIIGILRYLDLINPERDMVGAPVPLSCFAKLIVPACHLFRFPLSKKEDPEAVENLFAFSEKIEHNFELPELDYPKAALVDINQRSLKRMGLPHEPWPAWSDPKIDKPILLHIRAKHQQRKLTNALELKEILETQYRANVTVMQEAWLSFKFEKQAKTYNSFPYVITGHGAHLANGIFCRPNTSIVEIFCNKHKKDLNPNPWLKERGNSTFKDWWGGSYAQWFEPYMRRMDIHVFERGEKYPAQCGGSRDGHFNDIMINLNETVPLIVNRFGLEPREQTSAGDSSVATAR